jgi:hypothetical protein
VVSGRIGLEKRYSWDREDKLQVAGLVGIILAGVAAVVVAMVLSGGVSNREQAVRWVNEACAHHQGVGPQWDGGYVAVCKDGTAVSDR